MTGALVTESLIIYYTKSWLCRRSYQTQVLSEDNEVSLIMHGTSTRVSELMFNVPPIRSYGDMTSV